MIKQGIMKENAVIFKKKERKNISLSFKQIVFEALKNTALFGSSPDSGEVFDGRLKTHPDLLVSSKVSST